MDGDDRHDGAMDVTAPSCGVSRPKTTDNVMRRNARTPNDPTALRALAALESSSGSNDEDEDDDEDDEDEEEEEEDGRGSTDGEGGAETKARRIHIPEDITSINQLQWYQMLLIDNVNHTMTDTLQPCRVLSQGEAVICRRNNVINGPSKTDRKNMVMIQYLTFPDVNQGMYECFEDSLLIPFGHSSTDGLSAPSMTITSSDTCNSRGAMIHQIIWW